MHLFLTLLETSDQPYHQYKARHTQHGCLHIHAVYTVCWQSLSSHLDIHKPDNGPFQKMESPFKIIHQSDQALY